MDQKYIIDFSYFEETSDQTEEQLIELLNAFLQTSEQNNTDFYDAITLRDITKIARASHSMKSTYSYFKGSAVSEVMKRIEYATYNNECFENIELYFDNIKNQINYIEGEVKERIEELGGDYA